MNKKDFMEWLRGILIVTVIVFLVVGGIVALGSVVVKAQEKSCAKLGEQIGYNTQVISGFCCIEIRPNLWVNELTIAEFLPLIDCKE